MNKKEYLLQYKTLDNRIHSLLEEIEKWRERATKITPAYSDTPKGESVDKVQSAVESIILLQTDLSNAIDRLITLKKDIEKRINAIGDIKLRVLLKYKYIDGLTFEQIAVNMNYGWRQIIRLHGQALQQFEMMS